MMKIYEPNNQYTPTFALFALGFRPFFFLAAFFAPVLIVLWLMQLSGLISLSSYYFPIGWHAHEMLFGYTVAVIAGFLLTAAGNWTGMKVINGWRLALLMFVFLLSRFSPFLTELPHWIIAAIDVAFIPLVALFLAIPVIKTKQWSNFIFVPLLLLMAAANAVVHLSALSIIDVPVVAGSRAMLYLVILLIVIMGGRVIPFFTERGVAGVTVKKWQWIEWSSGISILLVMIADVFLNDSRLIGYFAIFAAIVHGLRVAGWYSNKIWQVPLVWILQIAYGWIVLGFIIKSAALFNPNASLLAYHAFTVGGIGIMTLGMMARVSLGHTGRDMQIDRWMTLSFVVINVAAVVRVIAPIFLPDLYLQLINIAAWLWVVAFVIFLVVYTPMWFYSRVDGREG